jgi:hypothetical protein
MKVIYEIGPEIIWIGGVELHAGVPQDVPDEIAETALREPTILFRKIEE